MLKVVVPIISLLIFSCTFFSDLVEPEEYSAAAYSGRVTTVMFRDSIVPVPGVKVSLGGQAATTDDAGAFTLEDIRTGKQTLTLVKSGYDTLEKKIQVKLNNAKEDFSLKKTGAKPVIEAFYALPNHDSIFVDSAVLYFSIQDQDNNDSFLVYIDYDNDSTGSYYLSGTQDTLPSVY